MYLLQGGNAKGRRSRLVQEVRKPGFTIVELLIVIVVIGILAAISIVSYNGIQNRARTTAIQSDLANNSKKIEEFNAINGAYPDVNGTEWWAELKSAGLSFTDLGNESYVAYCVDTSVATPGYALMIESESGNYYRGSQGGGEYTGGTNDTEEVCTELGLPDHGRETWIKGYDGWAGGSPW